MEARKAGCKSKTAALLVNQHGRRLTGSTLRSQFDKAKSAAAEKAPALASEIEMFRFYDLRTKAADDTADGRGEEAARDLLGHESVRTTQKHYLRAGKSSRRRSDQISEDRLDARPIPWAFFGCYSVVRKMPV